MFTFVTHVQLKNNLLQLGQNYIPILWSGRASSHDCYININKQKQVYVA